MAYRDNNQILAYIAHAETEIVKQFQSNPGLYEEIETAALRATLSGLANSCYDLAKNGDFYELTAKIKKFMAERPGIQQREIANHFQTTPAVVSRVVAHLRKSWDKENQTNGV